MAMPALFFTRVEELENSKFILSDKKIGGVLKSIVINEELFGLIKEVLIGFDFAEEFKKSVAPAPEYSNRKTLRPPADKKKLIAYTFCLLADFDSKKRDLYQFLQEYFHEDGSVYESYRKFIFLIIKPFRKAVQSLFKAEEEGGAPGEAEIAEREAEKFFDGENPAIDNMLVEELITKIQDVSTALTADNGISLSDKKEMLYITEGLGNAIITKETRLIQLLWIGFKHTLSAYKAAAPALAEIEKKLQDYKIN